MSNKQPNLVTTIVLYITGIFLIIVAVLLILQAIGIVSNIPNTVYLALLLFAIGSGLLYGIKRST